MHNSLNYEEYTCWFKSGSNIFVYIPTYLVTDWNDFNSKTLDAQGDRSKAILHAIGLRMDLKLKKNFYLTGSFMNYTRDTNYKHYDDVFSSISEGRIMLTYKL